MLRKRGSVALFSSADILSFVLLYDQCFNRNAIFAASGLFAVSLWEMEMCLRLL